MTYQTWSEESWSWLILKLLLIAIRLQSPLEQHKNGQLASTKPTTRNKQTVFTNLRHCKRCSDPMYSKSRVRVNVYDSASKKMCYLCCFNHCTGFLYWSLLWCSRRCWSFAQLTSFWRVYCPNNSFGWKSIQDQWELELLKILVTLAHHTWHICLVMKCNIKYVHNYLTIITNHCQKFTMEMLNGHFMTGIADILSKSHILSISCDEI